MKSVSLFSTLLFAHVQAKRYIYTTQTMTDCFKTTQTNFGQPEPTQGPDKSWTIVMPKCHDCQCSGCTYIHTYTATFEVFSPNGTARWSYPINEIYPGMSTKPLVAVPTSVPYGFTEAVKTCRICGDEPVVATMTFPRGVPPYRENIPIVREAVETLVDEAETKPTQAQTTQLSSTSDLARETGASKDESGQNTTSATAVPSRPISRVSRSSHSAAGDGRYFEDAQMMATQVEEPTPTEEDAAPTADDSDSVTGAASGRIAGGVGLALLLPLVLMAWI